jgi:Holliday junction resolvase RusA-like endonuclease
MSGGDYLARDAKTYNINGLVFVVPGEVKGKGRPKFTTCGKFARAYTPQQTANYENWIKTCFINQFPNFKKYKGALQICVRAYFIKPKSNKSLYVTKKPDADNIFKCLDALNGIAWDDDKQIVNAEIEKKWGFENKLEIYVFPLEHF